MGAGIALLFSIKGNPVTVVSRQGKNSDIHDRVRKNLQILCDNDMIKAEEIEPAIANIELTDDFEKGALSADLIIENIPEKLELKQDYFKRLDAICPESTIITSNTSVISITEIAKYCKHKERIMGTHFWNPAYLLPLVEVVCTEDVSQENVRKCCEIMSDAGKKPIVVKKDVPGFLANRMQVALIREALSIVQQGIADPADVDASIKYSFGLRLPVQAPFEVIDTVGADLAWNIHDYLFQYLEDTHRPLPILEEKIKNNELGFKTGGVGFQTWTPEEIEASRRNLNEGLIKVIKTLDLF